MLAVAGVLQLYNASQYSTLVRASFGVNGILFLLSALAIAFAPITAPLLALANAGVIATFIAALIIVQLIIALNGRIMPFRRRKGE